MLKCIFKSCFLRPQSLAMVRRLPDTSQVIFYYFYFLFAAIEKNDTNQQNKYHFHSTQLNFDWDGRVYHQFNALLKKVKVRSQASSEAFST